MAEKLTAGIGKGTPGPGRKKGVPNKINADIKAMIIEALNNEGGALYLQRQARENPSAFMGLVGKVLPTTMAGDPANPVQHIFRTIYEAKPK